jgi:hypothetical protein
VFQRLTRMTRGVGRTSPKPSAVSGSTRVPSHGGGAVPRVDCWGAADRLAIGGLGEGAGETGSGSAGVDDVGPDGVGGAACGPASCPVPHAARPLARTSPTSVNRT